MSPKSGLGVDGIAESELIHLRYHYRAEEAQWYKDNGCYEVKVRGCPSPMITSYLLDN